MNDCLSSWPISRALLMEILADRITDCFVTRLVWERLGYQPTDQSNSVWVAGKNTPVDWQQAFPQAPEVIANRQASVYLTRSIQKENKQLLKQKLNFPGYRIGELYPRRTRRATAVNWLLAWLVTRGEELPERGPLPHLYEPSVDPLKGHPGDPVIH
ncbi:DUF1823 family protein [Prochlorococcus sp. MIT 1307]|uniref:DUF1823 family protein n=1 Tax=Prochlorococcus sp. MIT 1307 TaxID=3096219 RepID=UPI002A758EFD|nr:DUF1823 family protein [Prochlorococcus sp. MIT 1307]